MKRMTTIGIAAMTFLFFTSCKKEVSTNVDKNRIYTLYEVSYDQNSNRTDVKATFRVDHSSGQKIELIYPSRVDFDGDRLVWKNITGTYELTRSGNLAGRPVTYIDGDGAGFTNSQAIGSIDLPYGLNSISRNGDFYLPWNGETLQAGETVTVIFSGGSQVTSKKISTSITGSSYIVLQRHELDDLTAGTAQIQISRERESSLLQSSASGGRIKTTYLSRKVNIDITE